MIFWHKILLYPPHRKTNVVLNCCQVFFYSSTIMSLCNFSFDFFFLINKAPLFWKKEVLKHYENCNRLKLGIKISLLTCTLLSVDERALGIKNCLVLKEYSTKEKKKKRTCWFYGDFRELCRNLESCIIVFGTSPMHLEACFLCFRKIHSEQLSAGSSLER